MGKLLIGSCRHVIPAHERQGFVVDDGNVVVAAVVVAVVVFQCILFDRIDDAMWDRIRSVHRCV